jgi:TolB-like protein
MHGLNDLSTYGTHPKDFDPEQVKPVLVNLDIIIKWYLKYKETGIDIKAKPAEETKRDIKSTEDAKKDITISRKKLAGILGGSMAIIASVFAVLYFSKIIGDIRPTKEIEKSIAVLPFFNDSPSDSTTYFINGLMDEILNNLHKIKAFSKVLSRSDVERYRDRVRPSIQEMGKKLDVNYLVEGSGQKYGNIFRMRVQLIETKKGNHRWAQSYEKEIHETKDFYETQSEIAQAIASALKATVTYEEKEAIEKVPTSNMLALNLYLRAKDYQNKYEESRDLSLYNTAVNLFKEALKIDSSFTRAYTGLATAYYLKYQWESYFKENYVDTMMFLAKKALSFDDKLAEAYYIESIYYGANGNLDEAFDNFYKALEINPDLYFEYYHKGFALRWGVTDYVKAIGNFNKALNLVHENVRPLLLCDLGDLYLDVGFLDKARDYFQEALALDGDSTKYFSNMSSFEFNNENIVKAILFEEKTSKIDPAYIPNINNYSFSGKDQEAYKAAQKNIERIKKSGELSISYSHRIGYAFWQMNKKTEAADYFNQQIRYDEESIKLNRENAQIKSAHYDLAATYAFLGDKKKAFQYLDEFNKKEFCPLWWITYFKYDPLFNSIRNEERFKKILQNVEAKYQAEHERVGKWLEEQGML